MRYSILVLPLIALFVSSCAVVRQDEIGVKRRLGKLDDKIIKPGPVLFNPFITNVLRLPIRTVNLEIQSNLPSKEGLNVAAVISILYKIQPSKVPFILSNIGYNYEEVVVSSVFRSAAADVCSRHFAKEMHSTERAMIEKEITARMSEILEPRGFIVEAVLMKNIQLPPNLSRAVEDKLTAEQEAQRMQFLLERERLEAQRKLLEATGTRDAQKLLSEGLTENVLRYQAIEAFRELSRSPNTKIIITDSQTPLMLDSGIK